MDKILKNVAEIKEQLCKVQADLKMLKTSNKAVLTFDQAAEYIGLSKSFLYKLTSTGGISCHKPNGKLLYFSKSDLDNFMLRNRRSPNEEIEVKANTYLTIGGQGNGNV
jgi:excisionase family DNA binding protein